MKTNNSFPILGFSAWSGIGKTTLLEQLIPLLLEAGIRVGLVKHAHHNFDIDKPGKDSYRLRQAGANPVLIISDRRLAFLQESATSNSVSLTDALAALPGNTDLDLLLVEGFKNADIQKIALYRDTGNPEKQLPVALEDPNIIAWACDKPTMFTEQHPELSVPVLDINQAPAIAAFIQQWMGAVDSFSCGSSLSLQAGLDLIHTTVAALEDSQLLELPEALGRVLAADIRAPIAVPAEDNSAMDGYACNFSELENQTEPSLQLIGESACGQPFQGKLAAGQCVRIFTGGILPDNCDTVIMQEHSHNSGNSISFMEPPTRPFRRGQHVRLAGEDISIGSVVGAKGEHLKPALMGVLASTGTMRVRVLRRPVVAFITNGNELTPLGTELGPGQCHDSNRYTLRGLLQQAGVEILDLGIVGDDPAALEAAIKSADAQADMVITTGGISVGDADFVKPVIKQLGEIVFSGLRIKPGHPVTFAKLDNSLFFGLPGNPVAVMVCFSQLVSPAIRYMSGLGSGLGSGLAGQPPLTLIARSEEAFKKLPGRYEFVRGILSTDTTGNYQVKRAGKQGSAILSTMSRANCFILLDETCTAISPGQSVRVQPFSSNPC